MSGRTWAVAVTFALVLTTACGSDDEAVARTSTTTAATTTTLRTGTSGLGERPILRWEPVDGAVDYLVVVNTIDGQPLWIWQGPDTEVAFGGGPIDDPDTAGARLSVPATWLVAAQGEAGDVVAVSAITALAP